MASSTFLCNTFGYRAIQEVSDWWALDGYPGDGEAAFIIGIQRTSCALEAYRFHLSLDATRSQS